MGKLIVLMGPTGAGKSVQGDLLAKDLGGVHLSSGRLLRRDPHAAAMLVGGQLMAAPEVERVVGEAIAKVPDEQPIVLDGTPRTMSNVHWMERNLSKYGRELTRVILIELDLETIERRLKLRNRADDTEEAIEAKWEAFLAETKPVISYYRKNGALTVVNGRGTVEEVNQLIEEALS